MDHIGVDPGHHGHLPLWNYEALGMPLAFNFGSGVFSLPALVSYLTPLRAVYWSRSSSHSSLEGRAHTSLDVCAGPPPHCIARLITVDGSGMSLCCAPKDRNLRTSDLAH